MRFACFAAAILVLPLAAYAQDRTGTLDKVKETGTITLGVRDASVPFSYFDG